MSIIGGDAEQLAALKALFEQEAGRLQELTANLRSQLANTYWQGPAAERFRDLWQSEYERVLHALSDALIDASQEVARAHARFTQP